MSASRTLVIDADLNPRIAGELRKRGRLARSLQQLELKDLDDPDLIRHVFSEFEDPVLVTTDDHMPETHAEVVAEIRPTIATIEPWELHRGAVQTWDDDMSEEEAYEREVIHRWAQSMQDQPTGTIMRYFLNGRREWRSRT